MRKCVVIILFICSTSYAGSVPALDSGHSLYGNLIGYWTFDDGSGTDANDSSANNHDGTLQNSPSWTTGQVGGALQFSGSEVTEDHVTFGDDPNFEMGNASADNAFTICAWVNPDVSNVDFVVLGKNDATTGSALGYYTWLDEVDSGLRPKIRCYDGSISVYIGEVSDANVTNPTSAHMYAWTYDATEASTGFTIYVDGASVASTASAAGSYTAMNTTTSQLRVGCNFHDDESFDKFSDGVISQVIFFDKELSSAEVLSLYNDPDQMEESGDTTIVDTWWRRRH